MSVVHVGTEVPESRPEDETDNIMQASVCSKPSPELPSNTDSHCLAGLRTPSQLLPLQ